MTNYHLLTALKVNKGGEQSLDFLYPYALSKRYCLSVITCGPKAFLGLCSLMQVNATNIIWVTMGLFNSVNACIHAQRFVYMLL